MFISKMHLPRRTVLRGIGATVALPLLDCMVPGADRDQQDRRGAGAAVRHLLRAQRDVDAVLVAEGRGTARRGRFAADAAIGRELRGPGPDVRRPERRGGEPGQGRRGARARGRHVPDLRAVPAHERRRRLRRDHDGPDRGAGALQGDADHLAGAGHRAELDAGDLRRRLLRLHQHDLLAHADDAAADGERSARGVRDAVRHQRQHRPGSAARPHAAGPQHPGQRERGAERSGAGHRRERPQQARRVSRRVARHRAAHPDGRAAERPRAAGGRSAGRRAERLRRARAADDGPAGARLADRPDPHQHVHAGARDQRPGVSGGRGARLAPPALASPGRAGEAGAAAQDQRAPLPAVRLPGREARRAAGGRRHDAGPHADALRDRHQRQQHALLRRPADRARGRDEGRHQGRALRALPAGHAAGEPVGHGAREAQGLACPWPPRRSATARARSAG